MDRFYRLFFRVRCEALARFAAAGDAGSAEQLREELEEREDESTLVDPESPEIRWEDIGHRLPEWVRYTVFVKRGQRCYACGTERPPFEIDHLVPLSAGGTDHLHNLGVLCRGCNRRKWYRSLHDFFKQFKSRLAVPPARRRS